MILFKFYSKFAILVITSICVDLIPKPLCWILLPSMFFPLLLFLFHFLSVWAFRLVLLICWVASGPSLRLSPLPPHPVSLRAFLSFWLRAGHKSFGIYSMWPDARFPLGVSLPGDGAGGLGCVTSVGWWGGGRRKSNRWEGIKL